jgi:hypothetical protein
MIDQNNENNDSRVREWESRERENLGFNNAGVLPTVIVVHTVVIYRYTLGYTSLDSKVQ